MAVTYMGFDEVVPLSEYKNKWQIYNGSVWVHGFETKDEAIEKAKKWNGYAVGYCTGEYIRGVETI